MTRRFCGPALMGIALALYAGCDAAPDAEEGPSPPKSGSSTAETRDPASSANDAEPGQPDAAAPKRTLRPVTLGSSDRGASATSSASPAKSGEDRADSVLQAMKPLQMVLVSDWHGISRKTKQQEELAWKWDLRTDREQPALVMTVEHGHHFREGRLTWLDEEQEFRLTAVDVDGQERVYRGTFAKPVEDVLGDDNKLHRTYKLQFDQVSPADDDELAQVVFNQQENNRYLMEVYDRRGERLQQVDVVGNQREGSSFAFDDSDYGDRTCVVSQGLGTMSVSYKGKTYYVCCTGCQAAFEEDPERWIAKLAEREKDAE